ncbi:hypothetical protein GALMADRAFT_206134 [Galerina marginata CBS 339.88]|uniref:Uncharacterized protein n=1 Tax=Galerina marginata (strain CBS 339.88) TaxID=685588 RepID=A0A067TMY4_GALM3|nr:hypothetical protein GALMADRAFT_206134 [Galerina marginata CBS 339.88]
MYPSIRYPTAQQSGWHFPMLSSTSLHNTEPTEPSQNRRDRVPDLTLSPLLPSSPLPMSSPLPPSSPIVSSSPPAIFAPLPSSLPVFNNTYTSSSNDLAPAYTRDDSEDEDDSPGKKRVRVSLRNAPHGLVEGAMKGTQKYLVARQKPMRPVIQEAHTANKRYKREIDNIVSRKQCERIAEETGAWLIFGAQQSGSGASITYSSSKLRKDALQETTSIFQQFQKTTKALTTAKYNDAKELAKQLHDVLAAQEAQKQGEQARLLEVQKKLSEQRTEMAAKDELIAKYRLQLGE